MSTVPISAIIPSQEVDMGRPRYTKPEPKPTGNKRGPRFVIRPIVDVLMGTEIVRKERAYYSPDDVVTMKAAWTLKPNTQIAYGTEIKIRILPQFGASRLCDLDPLRMQQWVNWMDGQEWQTTTMQHAVAVFRSIWEVAVDWGYTQERCPATRRLRIPVKAVEQRRAPLVDEFLAVRAAIRPSLHLAVDLCAFCGLRIGEVAALRRKHLDYTAGTIRIEESISGDGRRTSVKSKHGLVPMGFLRVALLQRCPLDAAPDVGIFPETRNALRMAVWNAFRKSKQNLPGKGAHLLRRFYATHASKFMSLTATQEIMRHADQEMTKHYISETIGAAGEAMERMKNEVFFGTFAGENAKSPIN